MRCMLMSAAMVVHLLASSLSASDMEQKRSVFEQQRTVVSGEKKPYLLYFFSQSVPYHSFATFLAGVDKLNRSGIDVSTVQYLRGLDGDFKEFMFNLNDMKEMHTVFSRQVQIKMHPKRFIEFDITKVPAVAYAECGASVYDDCEIKYLVRGDMKVAKLLDVLAGNDDEFDEWVEAFKEVE